MFGSGTKDDTNNGFVNVDKSNGVGTTHNNIYILYLSHYLLLNDLHTPHRKAIHLLGSRK